MLATATFFPKRKNAMDEIRFSGEKQMAISEWEEANSNKNMYHATHGHLTIVHMDFLVFWLYISILHSRFVFIVIVLCQTFLWHSGFLKRTPGQLYNCCDDCPFSTYTFGLLKNNDFSSVRTRSISHSVGQYFIINFQHLKPYDYLKSK